MGYKVMEKKRREDLDILKGIGIFLMVFDHVINVCGGYDRMAFVHQYIQSFHMPLFFITSGYLWKQRTNREEIKKKANSLLVPYAIFAIMYLALIALKVIEKMDLKIVLRFIAGILVIPTNNEYTDFASPIWFLVAIFNVEVIYNFIRSRLQNVCGGGYCTDRNSCGMWMHLFAERKFANASIRNRTNGNGIVAF